MSVQVTTDVKAKIGRGVSVHPRWLAAAHVVWLACAALALAILIAGIPLGYARLWSGSGFYVAIDAPAWYITSVSIAQGIVSFAAALVSLTLAVIVFWKKRDDRGALFVSFYLLAYGIILAGPLEALNGFPPLFPGAPTTNATLIPIELIIALQTTIFLPTMWLMYLFPNGEFVPRWTRFAALAVALIAPLLVYVSTYEWLPTTTWLASFVFAVVLGLMGVGAYAQIYRYRRVATPIERQQTKWVAFGMALTFFLILLSQIPYTLVSRIPASSTHPWWEPLTALVWWLSLVIIPLSFAIAVLGYHLWDIDILINRTLVYGTLTALIIGIFILVAALFGALFQTGGNFFISLVATAVIAVLFQPLRERLQRGVNRLMYGERDDPYRVLTRLGAQLENAIEPAEALTRTVETIGQALKLPFVAITLNQAGDAQTAAVYGSAPSQVKRFPLVYASKPIGELLAAPRAENETLTGGDVQVLQAVAQQLGIAAHAVLLNNALEQARLRLVTERGEARRRLGSDLHDGLGHQLVGLTRQVEHAMSQAPDSSARTNNELLEELRTQLVQVTAQTRMLAHQLYPPELEMLGLSGALQERAHAYPTLKLLVHAPQTLPPLPAEIEAAAYYIALEALTNVDKHANAKRCAIRLKTICIDSISQQHRLELDIADDGRGIAANATDGLGLLSMRARAAEVGGTCHILPNDGGGTVVRVRIPFTVSEA